MTRKLKLKDIGDIITGNTPSKKIEEYYNSNDINFFTPIDFEDRRINELKNSTNYISNRAIEKARMLPKESVLVTCIGIIGKVGIIEKESAFNQQINAIIPNKNIVHNRYLAYWLISKAKYLRKRANAPVVPIINKTDFQELEIDIPDMEIQKEITNKLDKITEILKLKEQQIKKCDELIKSQFVEMFGDIKTNRYNWEISILQKYFDIKGGKRIPKGMKYSDTPRNHAYLRATDMKNSTILDNDIKYIDEKVFEKIKRYTVEAGDIYLTNVGVNLGVAGIIPEKYSGANLTENAVKLVKKTKKINGKYLAYYINSEETQYYINQRKMSVGVPKLAIFRIKTMPLMIPPIELQNQFVKKLEQIDKQKLEIEKSLKEIKKLYESLLEKYFI